MNKDIIHNIDLNCDMGEIDPINGLNFDEKIMPFISSCNICCGYHSGSLKLSEQTIKLAKKYKLAIGAHPSYNDKENFGRISPIISHEILRKEITEQIIIIKRIAERNGTILNHIKPHGALYNDLAKDKNLAMMFIDLVKDIDESITVYGLANSEFEKICNVNKINFASEVFADREYDSEKQLRSRQKENSVISNKENIIDRVNQILHKNIIDFTGKTHKVNPDTLCLHSDTKGAIELAELIFNHLKSKKIAVLPVVSS